jgi:hypothetical protein
MSKGSSTFSGFSHKRYIGMLASSILSVLALALMVSAATSDPPKSTDPRDKLNIWEGRWKEQVETKETPYSHAASVPSHITCSWTADRGYMVCEYLSEKADPAEGRPSDHLTIFTYDDKGKAYKHLGISKDYKTLEEATTIEGNFWHYTYQLPGDKGEKLDLRDSYEFVTPEKRITRIEVSADGGKHWTLLSESVGIKVQ